MNPAKSYFIIIAFMIPLTAYFSSTGMSAIFVVMTLAALYLSSTGKARISFPPQHVMAALFLLAVLSMATAPFALDASHSFSRSIKLMAFTAAGFILLGSTFNLDTQSSRLTLFGLLGAFLLSMSILIIDTQFGNVVSLAIRDTFGHESETLIRKTYSAITILMIWPLAIFFANRKYGVAVAGIFLLLGYYTTIETGYHSGSVAIIGGFFSAVIAFILGRRAIYILGPLLVACFIAMPIFASLGNDIVNGYQHLYVELTRSLGHRLVIWDITTRFIMDQPFFGTGLSSSRLISLNQEEALLLAKFNLGSSLSIFHPHNAILQIWVELGGIGAILAATATYVTLHATTLIPTDRLTRALLCGQFITAFIILNLSFNLWQSWWMSTLWIAAAMSSIALNVKYHRG